MTENHPITPPLKLFREWTEYRGAECEDQFWWRIATQAARWGADQELEACCQALYRRYDIPSCIPPKVAEEMRDWLRATRRPKPPSLKEQALQALYRFDDTEGHEGLTPEQIADDFVLIRRALESLPD